MCVFKQKRFYLNFVWKVLLYLFLECPASDLYFNQLWSQARLRCYEASAVSSICISILLYDELRRNYWIKPQYISWPGKNIIFP